MGKAWAVNQTRREILQRAAWEDLAAGKMRAGTIMDALAALETRDASEFPRVEQLMERDISAWLTNQASMRATGRYAPQTLYKPRVGTFPPVRCHGMADSEKVGNMGSHKHSAEGSGDE